MDNDKYIGRLLDNRYEILEVIGVGGMAVVYKARCHRLNRLVAVKILKDDYSQDDEFRRRFHAEGQAVAMVSHPNIVSVYDVSTSNDADYIVMELIDGISLKQYMEKKGVLNWKETLHFAIQIGKALEHAHSRGIVHRDIKPHNVMVLKNGSVKVADFGIARVMSESNTLTREALGSVHYISPEQAKGGRVDNRSDLYSLGVVMYEMMCGRPPYNGESPVAVAIQHINGGAAMPSTINPNIPGGLEQIIMKAMAHEPAERYDNAAAMLYDMDEFRKNPTILFDYNIPPTDAVIAIQNPGTGTAARTGAAAAGAARTVTNTGARSGGEAAGTGPVSTGSRGTGPIGTGNRGTGPINTGSRGGNETGNAGARGTGPIVTGPRTGGRTTADRVTSERSRANGGAGARRTPGGSDQEAVRRRAAAGAAGLAGDGSARRRTQNTGRRDQQDDESRAATIAVIACSAVAVIALIIFLIVLITGGLSGNDRDMIVIPDFLGHEYTQVQADYAYNTNIHIKLNSETGYSYSSEYAKGTIMAQTPEGGKEYAKGTVVYVTVSLGEEPENVVMENHIGKSESEVRGYLDALQLDLSVEVMPEPNKDVEEGIVLRTDPVEGERLSKGMVVTLYVSAGPEVVEIDMPNLADKTADEAKNWLNKQYLDLEIKVEEEDNLEVEEGKVLRTKPAAGEKIKTGDTVILYVAIGLKTELMPKVSGMTFDQAKSTLQQLITDLNLKIEQVEEFDENTEVGKVIRTEPAFNENVKTGDTVKIFVCTAKTAKMPKVVGMNVEAAKVKLEEVSGFTKVTVEYKTSDKTKDTVISQSVAESTELELDKEIVLVVSSGTKSVKQIFALWEEGAGGDGEPTEYVAVIKNANTGEKVFEQTLKTDQMTVELTVTGYGVMEFVFEADGIEMSRYKIDFDK